MAAPNPTPTPTPTPPPHPTQTQPARKLPIKRKSPSLLVPGPLPDPPDADDGGSAAASPPFKFQRIWSEPDEIRFLQGLLGCRAQGLVFPRDLNLFYDRFAESMPQPYTRSQLSEKLRRLRNKHRAVSARLARGLDSSRLAPHDRDVLHLCSRLWDPAFASSSPFSSPPGSSGNKRRRANPRSSSLPLAAATEPLSSSSSPLSVGICCFVVTQQQTNPKILGFCCENSKIICW